MPDFHIDGEVNDALVRLNDALCQFERSTGREYLLMLVPMRTDEDIHVSESGKPVSNGMHPSEFLDAALLKRGSGHITT